MTTQHISININKSEINCNETTEYFIYIENFNNIFKFLWKADESIQYIELIICYRYW